MGGDLHLGFSIVNRVSNSIVPRLFIQGAIARDFIDHASLDPYPFIHLGFVLNITMYN
mgnify:CR=1 FL=1|jgi:hypothetical protein